MPETDSPDPVTRLDRGAAIIRAAVDTMPHRPGVYRMLDRKGDAVYVGKAKNLRKRVITYTNVTKLPTRLRRMVAETRSVEVVVTHTEVEALLLESNLIKKLKPRYNVLLRDDKSFPYILITADGDWPQAVKYRGSRSAAGEYFGPFASASAVNRTLAALQRAFLLRSCSDSVFKSRSRPCLLYQIKRCSAPCVGYISKPDYGKLVDEARLFLSGRSQEIQRQLAARMEAASADLRFEEAAAYRDRIRALTQVQAKQDINLPGVGDTDVIAIHQAGGRSCIQVFFFRAGRNYGNRAYFPRHDPNEPVERVLAAFLGQFYDNKPVPRSLLLSLAPKDMGLIEQALRIHSGHAVDVRAPRRGAKRKLVDHALANAEEALARHLAEKSSQQRLLDGVADVFGLDGRPQRIEVYDNSHAAGTHAVGGMIVAGPDGFVKSAYRKFNIKTAVRGGGAGTIAPGDDYGMMREVLQRRFARALKQDPERGDEHWPDLVLIDGGRGQLNAALEVLADLGIEDLAIAAIAKGADRNAGRETFHMPGRGSFTLPPKDPVLYLLQRLRDEAHRFAIGSHRGRRSKAIGTSILDQVAGIGARRKRALLNHFGSAANVAKAGLADLEAVAGISKSVAKNIYDHFHTDG